MKKEKFLKLKEVADRLRVHPRTVFRYIHSGRLAATKVGYWRIKESDFEKFLLENSNIKAKAKKKR